MKTKLIVNPTAGRGKGAKLYPRILEYLRNHGFSFEVVLTTRPGETMPLADQAIQEGYELLVSVGGDGTHNEIANSILKSGKDIMLGAISAGSGNDFVKTAGVPLELESACEVLHSGVAKKVDVGVINDRYFLNIASVGFDVAAAIRSQRMKILRGFLLYLGSALCEIFSYEGPEVTISANGFTWREKVLMISVANGKCYGGAFQIAPSARMDDDLLNAIILDEMNPFRRLYGIPKVMKGTHFQLRECHQVLTNELTLELDRPLPIHVDGEVLYPEVTEVTIKSIPQRLSVLVSAEI
ncbi:MAG: diacylglycerol kinase family lipid kinase [candidate division KSB1 bacterium]|nr:diacylglycerol kinase family lipid kinase [candidate division KSB1 bacterium]